MPLILSGGGDPEQVVPIDEYYASLLDLSKPVLYIPIAMEASTYTYDECLSWFTETYKPYGIEKAELCTDLSSAQIDGRYNSVFIGGGNTFKLLKAIKESPFEAQIKTFLENGGIVYGGSAGAIIFGETIETARLGGSSDENNVGLADLSGMNLCGDHDIFCHYTDEDTVPEGYGRPLYLLYEDSGIVIDSDVTALGKKFKETV